MKTVCKFNCGSWTRDRWSNKQSDEDISTIFEEVKSYINLSAKFNYIDWYGGTQSCNVKIIDVELTKHNTIVITEEANIELAIGLFDSGMSHFV